MLENVNVNLTDETENDEHCICDNLFTDVIVLNPFLLMFPSIYEIRSNFSCDGNIEKCYLMISGRQAQ